uniref:BTB domain-containing protein n=1 Tax=Pyrodinium bahamense TaxID=73915 RepID=A0A7S0BCB0_9DINO|mmetsp:Transcript_9087/g.25395  ORF Transcript_9087/g.25395 Transcript_9087/m.25395 type:complete len:369 (+) Transcript_9087:177-1283(+)
MERDSDWIWEALALGEESLLKDADIDYFDWNGTHEKYGTPLIALVVGKATGQEVYDFATGTPEKLTERLNLMKLVLGKGASPHAKPPPQFSICKSWWKTEGDKEVENSRTPLVHFNDKSAYGVVASCLEALTNVEGDWKRELRFLRDAAKILASYRPSGHAGGGVPRVAVAEGVVETWERILSTSEGADVTIACKGGGGGQPTELRAHATVLRGASKVLRAMLSPAFREGSTARVEVEFDAVVVRLLLSLIYTGEEVDETDAAPDSLLAAVELAHQWDVGHAVTALEVAVVRRIDDERFGRAVEVAARLQLPQLAPACMAFAKNSADVKRRFKAAQYPPAVQAALAQVFGDAESGDARRKRRRLIMAS